MEEQTWKIGELAKLTGLTVRALHHYDQIGLLSPSQLSAKDHRLYTAKDIVRLQQIISLKQLGFSLEEIKELLENKSLNHLQIINMQLASVKKQMALQEELFLKLETIQELLQAQKDVCVNQFMKIIEVTNMIEKYFTKEQLEKMKQQTQQFSDEEKQQIDSEWLQLITNIRAELAKNTPTNNQKVLQLASQWQALTNQFVAGDQAIIESAERFYAENPNSPLQHDVDKELYLYIQEAMSHI